MKPASAELMAHYRANLFKYREIADGLSLPRFTNFCRAELFNFLPDWAAIDLVEAVVRLGDYTNKADHESRQQAVKKLLNANDVHLPRGKRTRFDMLNLVKNIAPILLYYGLPCASSQRSHLVLTLTIIAEEIQINGDPRDELRRVIKVKKGHTAFVRKTMAQAFSDGLNPNANDYLK